MVPRVVIRHLLLAAICRWYSFVEIHIGLRQFLAFLAFFFRKHGELEELPLSATLN
jgi:hypothetical protein